MSGIDILLNNRTPPVSSTRGSSRPPVTGRVVRSDETGTWVAPIDGDQRHPLGPCRGPSDLEVGTIVMVISTQERPWVFGAELLTTLNAEARDLLLLEAAEDAAESIAAAAAADAVEASSPADRDRANHTGTQTASTISDLNAAVDARALLVQREVLTTTTTGDLTVASGVFRLPVGSGTWSITGVRATLGTAPDGADVIVDVNKNGTTIYGTPANRPTIADGTHAAAGGAASVTTVTDGDYFTVDVDQVGSTTPGADLVVAIRLTRTA